jgi:hypothetical protein
MRITITISVMLMRIESVVNFGASGDETNGVPPFTTFFARACPIPCIATMKCDSPIKVLSPNRFADLAKVHRSVILKNGVILQLHAPSRGKECEVHRITSSESRLTANDPC